MFYIELRLTIVHSILLTVAFILEYTGKVEAQQDDKITLKSIISYNVYDNHCWCKILSICNVSNLLQYDAHGGCDTRRRTQAVKLHMR